MIKIENYDPDAPLDPAASPHGSLKLWEHPVDTFEQYRDARIADLLKTPRCFYDDEMRDPNNFVTGINVILDRVKPDSVIEIGAARGVSTELFLLRCRRVTTIDPWDGHYELHTFLARCGAYPHLEFLKQHSPGALPVFNDGEFDMCYIDGDHTYDAVRADIIGCARIVRRSGWLAGHDIHQPAVLRAVSELLGLDTTVIFEDSSWLAHRDNYKEPK